jgi:hypothetical protein
VSDVDVVFAAEKKGQLLECRTHIKPVVALEQGWRVGAMPLRGAMRYVPVSNTYTVYETRCGADAGGRGQCVQVPVVRESATRYGYQLNAALPHYDQPTYQRRWRLQKSMPECMPLEGGEEALARRYERVEGHVYGCGEASGTGCEDQVL